MRTTKSEQVTVEHVDKIWCNRCEDEIPRVDVECENYFSGWHEGGFGSTLGDCTSYRFDLCESCLGHLFATFKIKPTIEDIDVY